MDSRVVRFAGMGLAVMVGLSGCARDRVWKPRLTRPDNFEVIRQQLIIHSDFSLDAHDPLVDELVQRRSDLCRHLDLPPSDEPIEVYLFEGAEAFNGFMRIYFSGLPARRAYFIQTDSRLTVYARWGGRVADDLRHEITHGYLHSIVPNVPLWLDEGLAKYYETPRGTQGVNTELLCWLRPRLEAGRWQPDLWRLEQLPQDADMELADYAESWAWVHFLLHSGPENRDRLRSFLAEVRRDGQPEPLAFRLRRGLGDPNAALLAHLRPLVNASPPLPAVPSASPQASL
jgi:hypothetical protein